ncbi:MAG: PaaI family thioesterase [bacterium]|nr:PaaI family thioesterase [bacterium]
MVIPLKDEQKCFACGKLNPYGLHLEFTRIDQNSLRTTFTPREYHQGWAEYLHGGLISTILDEVMVRLAYELGLRVMTAEINIRYKKAVKIGTPLVAESKLIQQNKRLVQTEAELLSADRTIRYAFATAKLILL